MLSADDRLAIYDLYARYCWANDAGNAAEWAATFTEDGLYESQGVVAKGRTAITALVAERIDMRSSQAFDNPQHWTGNLLLDGDAETARGRCYFMRIVRSRSSGEPSIQTTGWYLDELRKVNGRWAFQYRRALARLDDGLVNLLGTQSESVEAPPQ